MQTLQQDLFSDSPCLPQAVEKTEEQTCQISGPQNFRYQETSIYSTDVWGRQKQNVSKKNATIFSAQTQAHQVLQCLDQLDPQSQ